MADGLSSQGQGKFVVVGLGALGSEVLRTLCFAQPARLLLIDSDVLTPADGAKSWLLREGENWGANKALHAAQLVQERFPDIGVRALDCEFADTGWAELADADLLFSCVDNDLARLEMALVCRRLGLPMCDGGLAAGNRGGRVSWFPPGDAACFGCKLRPRRLRELLLFSQAEVRSCALEPPASFPMNPAIASLIAALQVDFGLRQWRRGATVSESIEMGREPVTSLTRFTNPVSLACPLHTNHNEERIPAPLDTPLGELLQPREASRRPYIHLAWPVCVAAVCRGCGCQWAPRVRVSRLRRAAQCPACGAGALSELASVQVIERDSKWAASTPRQLGLPDNHEVTIRFAT